MSAEANEVRRDVEIRRLSNELEHLIKAINSAHISEEIGDVSKESFTRVAESVSLIRARYLKQVIEMQKLTGSGKLESELFSRLRSHRLAYEEALEGFNALYHALEKGYFKLSG